MTLDERLAASHQRSVALYLQRQQVAVQQHQVQRQGALIDQELLQLDGQIELLTILIAEAHGQ